MVAIGEITSRRGSPHHGHHEECYSQLPQKFLDELHSLDLSYPGFPKDFAQAQELFNRGSESNFVRALRRLKDKQRVYDEYKAHLRLQALASLDLTYPGHDYDKQHVEQWHLQHPSNDDTDMVFQDKLEGLRNKEKLFLGDRSHPNIEDLDLLDLTYPDWEIDYQAAITAHCDTPGRSFANKLHRLRQKQSVFEGNRSHWRLVELDNLKLTYPGWESDWQEVEDWHFNFADTPKNNKLFAEVVESLKDQEQIFLGWDHEGEEQEEEKDKGEVEELDGRDDEDHDESSKSSKESATSSNSRQSTSAAVERERAKMEEMVKFYTSISENLNNMEGMKKKLMEERSTCSSHPSSRSSSPERDGSSSKHSSAGTITTKSQRSGTVTVTVPLFTVRAEEARPPKQVRLGTCEVCFVRAKTHVFVPCGHLCACAACSHKAMEETGCCPICRVQSQNSFRVFLT